MSGKGMEHLRVRSSDGNRGTIRWRGRLLDTKGVEDSFIGIEWDDPSRGKHNGEYRGEKLFSVSVPNSASFVRESTVKIGEKLSDVIGNYPLCGGSLSIDSTNIESVGDISNFATKILNVNASFSLVASFQFVWDLLSAAPHINTITLGRVHFVEFQISSKLYDLKEIVLNDTNITNNSLDILLKGLPKLTSIDITRTKVTNYALLSSVASLESINIDYMGVQEFGEITGALGQMPKLRSLSLNGNMLRTVSHSTGTFSSLTSLFLSSNQFSNFTSFEGLNDFPSLIEVHARRNPIEDSDGELRARLLMIRTMRNIRKLNGSEITFLERKQADSISIGSTENLL